MTQIAKLLEKIRRNTRNVSLEEFESVATHFGEIEQGGKHPRIVIGKQTLPYKPENPIKSCYVSDLLDIIDEEVGRTKK
jgi:hypothetical protein